MFPEPPSACQRTRASVNREIEAALSDSVRWHAAHPEKIDARLRELEPSGMSSGRWRRMPRLWLHGHRARGNCGQALARGAGHGHGLPPPARHPGLVSAAADPAPLGFRTMREIDTERYTLKALRGDFGPLGPRPTDQDSRASHALQAARR